MLRPLALLFSSALALSAAPALDVWHAKSDIRTVEPTTALKLTGDRKGDLYRPRLTNTGKTAGARQGSRPLPHRARSPRRHRPLWRELPDAHPNRRHPRQARRSCLRRTEALQDPAARRRQSGHRHDDAHPSRRRDHAARLHQLPSLQRPLLPAPEIHRSRARYRRPRARSRRILGPRGVHLHQRPESRRAARQPWPTASTRTIRRCASRLRPPAGAVGTASARA